MAEVTTTKTYHLSLSTEEYRALFQLVDDARQRDSSAPLLNVYKALFNPDVPEADL